MMRKTTLLAAGLAAGLTLGVTGASAQSPNWDLFTFNRDSTSTWSLFSFFAPSAPETSDGNRPVVTIQAPPATQQTAVASAAPFASAGGGSDSFWDPIERVWVTYNPGSGSNVNVNPVPRQEVDFQTNEPRGTIVISTSERRLYLVLGNGRALRYGIGVGRDGFTWTGVKSVTRMAEWPDWRPPEQMLRRRPDLPRFMPGGPSNPLGARALYLGSTLYRIHGSNEPHTIGQAVSSGCFRMTNADVEHLYSQVRVGARVVVR